jgi:hypothetical protein
MKSIWGVAVFVLLTGGQSASPSDDRKRSPVLVELFTSEGCSSCPPADKLLESLDRAQPVEGAETIVLSEHVDYWNHAGWTDPFSSARFSQRQQMYARRFKLEGPYTPQMVVDGNVEFVGSDGRRAVAGISNAAATEKALVRISSLPTGKGSPFRVRIEVSGSANAEVFVALALNEAESQVVRGENGGRKLRHVAVVRSLAQIGKVRAGDRFSKAVDLPAGKEANPQGFRIVVFVQERGQGRVLGAASFRPGQ